MGSQGLRASCERLKMNLRTRPTGIVLLLLLAACGLIACDRARTSSTSDSDDQVAPTTDKAPTVPSNDQAVPSTATAPTSSSRSSSSLSIFDMTKTPTPTIDDVPSEDPEFDVASNSIIAEVDVKEIYSPRSNSSSGVILTRDPGLSPGGDKPTNKKRIYFPMRVDVLHYYRTDWAQTTGFLLAEYISTASDYEVPLQADLQLRAMDLNGLSVGTQGIMFLNRLPTMSAPIRQFLLGEAVRLTSGDRYYDAGLWVEALYRYEGEIAVRESRPVLSMPIKELKQRIVDHVAWMPAIPTITPTPWLRDRTYELRMESDW